MTIELKEVLSKYINEQLINLTISNPRDSKTAKKITVRPCQMKGRLLFQECQYKDDQVFHFNINSTDITNKMMEEIKNFKQLEIQSNIGTVNVLISKKGKITIKEKKVKNGLKEVDLSHNKQKRYLLDPNVKVDFLVDLGVQTAEGKLINSKYDKFRQINRFLEMIEDILPHLPNDREVSIIDFGCGKSYLTFAMYYFLCVLNNYQIRMVGLDLKQEVIEKCNALAYKYEYKKLSFQTGDIAEFQHVNEVDMVVSLHACDTATDFAIHKAIKWNAKVILAVPCCQHELNGQIENELFTPILKYGIIKERMSALLTDALRGQVLESEGYQVQILEFINMEHTPKNILIRAIKKSNNKSSIKYEEIMDFFHVSPTLALLQKNDRKG